MAMTLASLDRSWTKAMWPRPGHMAGPNPNDTWHLFWFHVGTRGMFIFGVVFAFYSVLYDANAGEAPHRGALPGALPAEHASLHGGEVEPRPAGPAWGRPHPEHFSRHRATRVLGLARLTLHALPP